MLHLAFAVWLRSKTCIATCSHPFVPHNCRWPRALRASGWQECSRQEGSCAPDKSAISSIAIELTLFYICANKVLLQKAIERRQNSRAASQSPCQCHHPLPECQSAGQKQPRGHRKLGGGRSEGRSPCRGRKVPLHHQIRPNCRPIPAQWGRTGTDGQKIIGIVVGKQSASANTTIQAQQRKQQRANAKESGAIVTKPASCGAFEKDGHVIYELWPPLHRGW